MKNNYTELALSLNNELANTVAYRLFSERGKRIYFPHKGILGQSAEAKTASINATIGTAFEDSGAPLTLPSVEASFNLPATSFLYQPSFGNAKLRKKWKESLLKKNPGLAGLSFSEPVVTAALTHALSVMSSLFVNEGDTIILPDLYWDNYELVFCETNGANLKTFNTFKNGNFDLEAFAKCLENQKGKKIVLLNFPNNPTGYTVTEKEANEVVAILEADAKKGNDILVLLDDAYFGLVYETGVSKESLFGKLATASENLLAVKLDGPTKEDYVWSFRIGFVSFAFKGATEKQLKALEDKTAGMVRASISNAPGISQEALVKGYENANYEKEKQEKYNTLKMRYEKIKEIFAKHPEYAESFSAMPFNSGYFMCVKVNGIEPELVRLELLKNYGVGVIVLSGLIRIAFSSVSLSKLEDLFEKLNAAVRKLK